MQSWDEIKQWRRSQRETLLRRRIEAGGKQRSRWGAVIEAHLRSILPDPAAKTIGFYWPFKGEFDTRSLVRELIEREARAALPAVVEPKTPLEFRLWRPGVEMTPGVYKIPVPKERIVVIPDLLLIPLVGFDPGGYRLGYGAGYYDRTLANLPYKPFAIGIGFELSRLATIHPQPHDIPMDAVVTENGIEWRSGPSGLAQ